MLEMFADQEWYVIVAEVIGFANMVTIWISDRWANSVPWIKPLNKVLNWLSLNLFNNKNKDDD